MSDIRTRVLGEMGKVLGIKPADIPDDAAPGIVENWDSLRHMQLIVALEEAFRVRFGDHELARLTSIPAIVDIVSSKVKG